MGACGAVPGGNAGARGGVPNEGARRRAQPLHLAYATGLTSGQPPTDNGEDGNTRERLGTALGSSARNRQVK